jgi:hypothetical protein
LPLVSCLLLVLGLATGLAAGCGGGKVSARTATTATQPTPLYIPAVPKRSGTIASTPSLARLRLRLKAICRAENDGLASLLDEPLFASESTAAAAARYRRVGAAYRAESRLFAAAVDLRSSALEDWLNARHEVALLLGQIAVTTDRVRLHTSIGQLEQRAKSARVLARLNKLGPCVLD